MSATTSLLQICPNIQGDLDANWANCHSSAESLPLLEFLLSPTNKQPIVDMMLSGSGKIRRAELVYSQRLAESEVNTNQSITACASSNKEGNQKATYDMDINQNVQSDFFFDLQDFHRICQERPEIIAKEFQKHISGIERKVASLAASQLVLAMGKWSSDTSTVTNDFLQVNTLDADGKFLAQAYAKIKIAKAKTGFCAPTVTFSGTNLYDYFLQTMVGCCADNGLDVGAAFQKYGETVIWDRRVETAFSDADKAMMLQVGAAQLLNFSLFEGDGTLRGSSYERFSIISPSTGLKLDVTTKDDCGKLIFVITATTKLISLPTDMFAAGDIFEGVNYITGLEVNNS